MWKIIKDFISNYWKTPSQSPVPPVPNFGIGITSDIGAVANGIGDVAKVTDTIVKAENTPQMIQGRLNEEEQRIKDGNAKAVQQGLKTGDISDIEKRLS